MVSHWSFCPPFLKWTFLQHGKWSVTVDVYIALWCPKPCIFPWPMQLLASLQQIRVSLTQLPTGKQSARLCCSLFLTFLSWVAPLCHPVSLSQQQEEGNLILQSSCLCLQLPFLFLFLMTETTMPHPGSRQNTRLGCDMATAEPVSSSYSAAFSIALNKRQGFVGGWVNYLSPG